MLWLFGSKEKDIQPVVQSQNPDLSRLNAILSNKEAVETLRVSKDILIAYDTSKDGLELLAEHMTSANVSIQKALSKIGAYQGDRGTLELAKKLADNVDVLFDALKRKYDVSEGNNKPKRSID